MTDKRLTLTESNARSAYQKASKSKKEWMREMYPDFNFERGLLERIETYVDACNELGFNPLTISDFSSLPEMDRESSYAYHQLTIIARVLNEGWEPDYSNENEYKYYPYFVWDNKAAGGSGFSCFDRYFGRSYSHVGSRLVFKTRELAIHAGKKFNSIYNQYLKLE